MPREYRICKLKILRTLLEKGILLPLDEGIREQLKHAYIWTEKAQIFGNIDQLEKDLDGWEINSLSPIEKESSEDEMVILALLSRINGRTSEGMRK